MTPIRKGFLVICIFLPFTLLAQAPGDLDSTFSGDGKLFPDSIAAGGSVASYTHIRAQGGKLLYYGSSRILRFNDDGSLDSTFGLNGILAIVPFHAKDLLVQPDGRFIVVGTIFPTAILARRFEPDGEVDTTFAINGVFSYSQTGCTPVLNGACIQSDQCLLLGGALDLPGAAVDSGLVIRLTTDGALDPSFSQDGVVSIPGSSFEVKGLVQKTDGSIVLSRQGPLMIISSDGTLPQLTGAGPWQVNHPAYFGGWSCPQSPPPLILNTQDVLLHRSELVGWNGHFADFRVRIMETFNGAAENLHVLSYSYYYGATPYYGDVTSASIDGSDGFLVTGGRTGSSNTPWQIWRFNSDGTRDSSFAVNGLLETEFSPGENCLAVSVCVQPDGKFIVAGWAKIAGVVHAVICRYHYIPDPRAQLSARVFLGGPYNPVIERMHDSLCTNGLLPTSSPYPGSGFTAVNAPAYQTMHSGVMDFTGDSAIVDWVWLELFDAGDTATVRAARAALLRRDGLATGMDGRSPVDFNCGAGTFFLRVRHRNHLGTTCSAPVTLGAASTSLDLTSVLTPTFGTQAQHEINGRRMLWPGDANGDGMVKYSGAANDRDVVLLAIGGTTVTATLPAYHGADVNLDGLVKYAGLNNDRDRILLTIGGSIPTAVRLEQVP